MREGEKNMPRKLITLAKIRLFYRNCVFTITCSRENKMNGLSMRDWKIRKILWNSNKDA